MEDYRSLSHTKWQCKYHIVFIPKYRKRQLYGVVRKHLGEVFHRLAKRFYRDAQLTMEPAGDKGLSLKAERSRTDAPQPTTDAARRGTVFHERRVGTKAAAFVDGGDLVLRIDCSSPTAALDVDDQVPYALAVSVEVGVETGIPVYEQVRNAVATRVGVAARIAAS